jgi:hypothetical protein
MNKPTMHTQGDQNDLLKSLSKKTMVLNPLDQQTIQVIKQHCGLIPNVINELHEPNNNNIGEEDKEELVDYETDEVVDNYDYEMEELNQDDNSDGVYGLC